MRIDFDSFIMDFVTGTVAVLCFVIFYMLLRELLTLIEIILGEVLGFIIFMSLLLGLMYAILSSLGRGYKNG